MQRILSILLPIMITNIYEIHIMLCYIAIAIVHRRLGKIIGYRGTLFTLFT